MQSRLFDDVLAKGNAVDAAAFAEGRADPAVDILAGDVSMPVAILLESRIAHNLRWMQDFVDAYGLNLAPHGKTTMAPALFRRQLDAGAWGITVATAHQAQVAAAHGVRRILIANQVVGRGNLAILAGLSRDPDTTIFCLVDSAAGVEQLAAAMRDHDATIDVLLELAPAPDQGGYRTGVRDAAQQATTLAAIAAASPRVRLAGVELYEGVLADEAEIRTFLRRAVRTVGDIARNGGFARTPAILSGAGSAWYDIVAEEFARAPADPPVEIVLRPGCYLSHDAGLYRTAQDEILARNPVAARMREGLLPALQIWACVQSRPDPARAVVAMGKRDVAFDAGLPMPRLHFRPGRDTAPVPAPANWTITGLMDQHAYMSLAGDDDVRVGDLLGFDVSHPCLTFDKWRQLLVVDDAYRVRDVVKTFF
ncbi:amino acid deaminase [Sphingomonas sp. Leaf357]|uniref:amino acid deaminase n=1 Tax=Sphingomonas sp. Leaf357 TaxID=1736350 RepID=UPI0006FD5FC6|nr:amino acid deaminase [Sphingomonas sp. Leaf357]KQS01992.1 amino acid deaminase [Sphingomonas sp. Leaf357]